jgi:hypothetical protein
MRSILRSMALAAPTLAMAMAVAGPALAQSGSALPLQTIAPAPPLSAPPPALPATTAARDAETAAPAVAAPAAAAAPASAFAQATAAAADTYDQQDIITAADGAFGKGAASAAKLIERIFKDRGKPNGYIVGREVSGAFFAGLRYGSGTLFHKIEGQIPVFWTGPSLGFDVGGDGSKVFTLVYDLNDTADLFRRYPGAEGKAYLVGGFTANYQQRDNVVLVPIKLGVGWRLGINAGWLNYTRKSRLLPF